MACSASGCYWSLVLLMFAVGMGSLGWMLVLGATMAVGAFCVKRWQ
jgi:predicted metal-binding membrane protein